MAAQCVSQPRPSCSAPLRHKDTLIAPEASRSCTCRVAPRLLLRLPCEQVFTANSVPLCNLRQRAGEFVVTWPRAYHFGFNMGTNCAGVPPPREKRASFRSITRVRVLATRLRVHKLRAADVAARWVDGGVLQLPYRQGVCGLLCMIILSPFDSRVLSSRPGSGLHLDGSVHASAQVFDSCRAVRRAAGKGSSTAFKECGGVHVRDSRRHLVYNAAVKYHAVTLPRAERNRSQRQRGRSARRRQRSGFSCIDRTEKAQALVDGFARRSGQWHFGIVERRAAG